MRHTLIAIISVLLSIISPVVCEEPNIAIRQEQRMLRRNLQTGVPYKVNLMLALDYLNETTALQLETSDSVPSTNASTHFCYAVNTQASGNQVASSAAAIGATIQTRYVDANSTSSDSQCTILGTNRYYMVDSNATPAGFFRLLISVGQIVYVQSINTTLSFDEVRAVVETGFSRGQGGRLRFRSLLVTNPYFRTVVNVEVLNNVTSPVPTFSPSTSSPSIDVQPPTNIPQLIPSMSPSSFPTTERPSVLPSALPKRNNPSSTPSHAPTAFSKFPFGVINPTSSPTLNPSIAPSRHRVSMSPVPGQTILPSNKPMLQPPSNGMEPPLPNITQSDGTQAIVVGSIVGGIAFVLATLFLVTCICLPFCCRRKNGNDHGSENASGSFPGHLSNQTPTTHQMAVPGVLTLDEDAQSLANTTLDGKSSAQPFTGNQFSASPQRVEMSDSFDENSIYTSTTDPSAVIASNDTIKASSQTSDDIYDRIIEMQSTDKPRLSDLANASNPVQLAQKIAETTDSDVIEAGRKEFDPFEDDNEHYADDESSLEFGSSVGRSDPTFSIQTGPQSTSLSSDQTRRIEHGKAQLTLSSSVESSAASQNSHRNASNEIFGDSLVNSALSHTLNNFMISDEAAETRFSTSNSVSSLIGDVAAETRFSTSNSVSSLKSAPSRLVTLRPKSGSKPASILHGRPPQHRNQRTSNQHRHPYRFSTRSVGPSFRRRLLISKTASEESEYDQTLRSGGNGESPALSSKQRAIKANGTSGFEDPFLDEYVGLQMPSTDAITEMHELQHILPRQTMSIASYRDEYDSPTMNSSRYGNDSSASSLYDSSSASGRSGSWLFDTDEHTFDSDPRISDYQSATGHSSQMSGRRYPESEHGNYIGNEGFHQVGTLANDSSTRAIMDEQKSADHAAGPYSRQSALGSYGPSSISSSSTTGSGSRSTLSSRIDAQLKEQYEILAPPGKINIVLVTDFHNGTSSGTVISKVRATSALQGKLCEGDELVAIDGDDVTNMLITEITAMMASRAGRERKLTVLRDPSSPNVKHFLPHQETKHDGNS